MEKAEISELYCRKAPRIISRGRLRLANALVRKEKECVKNDCEEDDEVGEGFVVRGGVMMRIADMHKDQWDPMKRFYIDVNPSQIYQHTEAYDGISLEDDATSSHVTVEVSALPSDGRMFHICDNLPGLNHILSNQSVANEVESYPCRYCPNRIFLTSFGLERHTEVEHKSHLPKVMEEISRIHNEWRRREEIKSLAMKRREALKKTKMLTEVVRRSQSLLSEDRSTNRDYTSSLSCHICGLDFETKYEFVMNHFRAHSKNSDLRRRLLANFGPSYVARCTCHQCHLVFVNEKNLMLHKESSHLRKRKYVCKWCGDVCLSVNKLNKHKRDMHDVPCSRPEKSSFFISTTSNSPENTSKLDIIAADGNSAEKQTLFVSGFADTSGNHTPVLNHTPCTAKCGECGLTTMKPSLLIRHMQRVHNKNCFSAIIEVKGLPNIRVDMDRGKVTWWCCNFSFEDKKTCHQPVLEYRYLQNCPIDTRGQVITMLETGREFMSAGRTVQLINPDETQDDELYVLMAEENPEHGRETVLREMRAGESMVEGAQQITLTDNEFMQLRQQVGENFDGTMQIFLVDDMNDAHQPSPNSGVEPPAGFVTNNVVDNDVLNSLLLPTAQMPPTDDKYFSGTHSTESEFSIVNIPVPTEDKILRNALPLRSESLTNVETSSASLSIPTVTFSGSLVDNAPNCHFQVQSGILNELTAASTAAISQSAQQLHGNVACSSTIFCPELEGVPRSAPGTSSYVTGYCTMEDLKTRSFLVRPSDKFNSVLDGISTLLDLDRKDTLTAVAAKTLIETTSLEHLPTAAVRDETISSYISQDINFAITSLRNSATYNLSLDENENV